jgi:hypothetical protein
MLLLDVRPAEAVYGAMNVGRRRGQIAASHGHVLENTTHYLNPTAMKLPRLIAEALVLRSPDINKRNKLDEIYLHV